VLYSGGGGQYSNAVGTSVTINFTGTYLRWVGTKAPNHGIAKVTVDGTTTFDVDLYNPTALYQRNLWDATLPSGAHTVKIEVTADKNPASTGTYVGVDAFNVLGTVTQAYVLNRYEDDNPRLTYSGSWSATSTPEASGGSDKRANTSAAMVSVTFTGVRLDWIATTGPGMGTAVVSVDNGAATSVDLSGPTTAYQQNVWSTGPLSAGTHKVQISWDEGNALGAYITLDAFDVLGTLPAPGTFTTADINWVEQKLADLSYLPGKIDGIIDYKTRGAITAFQKWEGLTRDGNLSAAVWTRLQTARRPAPSKSGATNPWIEVNKTKQVLLYCKNGAVVYTLHVCTGSASVGIVTPSGTFKVLRKSLSTSPLYKPMYFRPSPSVIAIHGYPSVPTAPASHGCVRTQVWDQDVLYPLVAVGTYLYIY
jgi:peptidoglycan hydrolase-like protein with peptidoglycan-binding domain